MRLEPKTGTISKVTYQPKYFRTFSCGIFLLLLLAMAVGVLNPLYADEIAYRMLHARLFLDSGKSFILIPQCFPADWEMPVSSLMVPYNALESIFYNLFSTPIFVRIASVSKGMLFVFLFYRTMVEIFKTARGEQTKGLAFTVTLATFGLGVATFLFVINRPEQELLLAIFGILFLVLKAAEKKERDLKGDTIYVAAFVFLLLLAFGAHPNTLYFLPFLLFAAYRISARPLFKAASLIVVLTMAADSIMYMSLLNSCPSDPIMRLRLNFQALQPYFFYLKPLEALHIVINNLLISPSYFSTIAFAPKYAFGWLPPQQVNFAHSIANLAFFSVIASAIFTSLLGLSRAATDFVRKKALSLPSQLGLVLFFSLFFVFALQIKKNWYSTALVLPLTSLLFALFWGTVSKLFREDLLRNWQRWVQGVSLGSLLLLLFTYASGFPSDLLAAGAYAKGGLSFSGFNYREESEKIWAAAGLCGFKKGEHYRRIGVDNLTYWTMREVVDPIEIYYVSRSYAKDPTYSQSIGSLETFLKARGSDGIVARCDEIIEQPLLQSARKFGQYCCWNFHGEASPIK